MTNSVVGTLLSSAQHPLAARNPSTASPVKSVVWLRSAVVAATTTAAAPTTSVLSKLMRQQQRNRSTTEEAEHNNVWLEAPPPSSWRVHPGRPKFWLVAVPAPFVFGASLLLLLLLGKPNKVVGSSRRAYEFF